MFDIGFLELIIISIIGLMVLGPERLPGAVRTASLYISRFKRGFNKMRNDIEKELGGDEMREALNNDYLSKLKESIEVDLIAETTTAIKQCDNNDQQPKITDNADITLVETEEKNQSLLDEDTPILKIKRAL